MILFSNFKVTILLANIVSRWANDSVIIPIIRFCSVCAPMTRLNVDSCVHMQAFIA
jgi:hypothetical protein